MLQGIDALSEREKAALRLLLSGHDAKSIARHLDLSVHTVNDRLRAVRRKLGVSSSREAARLLAKAEGANHNFAVPENFGIADRPGTAQQTAASGRQGAVGHWSIWLGGAMLMLSLFVAGLLMMSRGDTGSATQQSAADQTATTAYKASASASIGNARTWLRLVDTAQWTASWQQAGTLFRSQITAENWTATIKSVREPFGALTARTFGRVTKASALPGMPPGQYELLEFRTDFAARKGVVETVVLAREQNGWKVIGYFLR